MLKIRHIRYLGKLMRFMPICVDTTSIVARTKTSIETQLDSRSNSGYVLQSYRCFHLGQTFEKSKRTSSKNDEESDDDEETDTDFKDERDSRVLKTKVNSLRADLLLRAGLGIARNKVETIFYESKIRINGQKLGKKSEQLNIGDEIDVIRGFSQSNPAHLVVARVIVLAANEREEGYGVSLRRYKSLLIENYKGANAYKSSEAVQH